MSHKRIAVIVLVAAALASCDDHEPATPQIRPVRTVTVERHASAESLSLTGQIRAQDQANFAFRLDGRMIERLVNVGDSVKPRQVIARLDPQIQQNVLRQSQANLSAAQGQMSQARNEFERQRQLLESGNTPRARFEQAQQARQTAEAQVNAAQAQLHTAQDQLGYTDLMADSAGTVTAIGAEPGEVVAAGRMIAQVARQGGRDAVFDVPAQLIRTAPRDLVVEIALTDDPRITVSGRVREVAPQADPATRTFLVKVGLIDPPETMRLGATVTGHVTLTTPAGVEIPAGALTRTNGLPAVWVVDPTTETVSLRTVEIQRYDSTAVVVSQGLETGEAVVTAGVQVLRPGQKVRLLGDAK
jgi:RND family efflux transporter MFP subunit